MSLKGLKTLWGKGKNTGLPAFSPFPTMLSKGFLPRVIKSWDCVVKSELFIVNNKIFRLIQFNLFPNMPWFLRVCSTCLLKKQLEKENLLVTSNFSLFPQCFLPILGTFGHFHQICNCRLQTLSVWKRLKFVVWERVKGICGYRNKFGSSDAIYV